MNALFDLSLPENRREKKKRAWELVPKDQWPVCNVCNKSIPFDNDSNVKRWLIRVVCRPKKGADHTCFDAYMIAKNKDRAGKKQQAKAGPRFQEWKKPVVDKPEPRKKLSEEEENRLETERAELHKIIDQKDRIRRGVEPDFGRVLSRDEIEAVKHTLSPPGDRRREVYYMPWLPKGSVQL